jgi:hypothetical protein
MILLSETEMMRGAGIEKAAEYKEILFLCQRNGRRTYAVPAYQ